MRPAPAVISQFNGEAVALPLRSGDFRRLGMSFVHQNLELVTSLTVLENLRLAGLTTSRAPFINWRQERRLAVEALSRFGLSLDPNERVDRLTPVERALLAIVRAFEEVALGAPEHRGPRTCSPGRTNAFSATRGGRCVV